MSIFKLEEGWLAYILNKKTISILFECPDPESARLIIRKIQELTKGGSS